MAINVLPEAVGIARRRLLSAKSPLFIASSCGGYKALYPFDLSILMSALVRGRSPIFMENLKIYPFIKLMKVFKC